VVAGGPVDPVSLFTGVVCVCVCVCLEKCGDYFDKASEANCLGAIVRFEWDGERLPS
jgi:hypothetical protein